MKKIFISFSFTLILLPLAASAQSTTLYSKENQLIALSTGGSNPATNGFSPLSSPVQQPLNDPETPTYAPPATYVPLNTSSNISPSGSNASLSTCQSLGTFQDVANCGLSIINLIIPLIVAITIVWTIYSSFELARTEGDDRKKWGWAIFYGLLGIFLMISVYGLVAIFTGTFGFSGSTVSVPNLNSTIQYPQ